MSVPAPMEGFSRGTVPWVVRALVDWAGTVGQGMALVVWRSARERDLAVADVQERFREKGLKTDEVRALRLTLEEFVRAIERNEADVLLVVDADAVIFGGEDRASWRLNFFRESLVAFRGAQIWFMPDQAAIRFSRDLPDLARFFLFRETLTVEAPSERGAEIERSSELEPEAQDSPRGGIFLERALQAAAKGGDPPTIWVELGLPAIGAFLGARNLAAAESAMASITEVAGPPETALVKAESEGIAQDRLASGYDVLGIWYREQGMLEEALAAQERGIQLWRQAMSVEPNAFFADLALSLNNLSGAQSNLGRREDALATIEEAVRIYRQLASARPETFLPNLAAALNNLSIAQGGLGRHEDALATIEEAVGIHRQLVRARPEAFLPDLAMSLNSLFNRQRNVGRREDALATIKEAVLIRRQLASTRPDAFLPDLAGSLNNLSIAQGGLRRHEDALATIEEAVHIYRQLVSTRRGTFLPDLAMSLNSLFNGQRNVGQREGALATIEEAVRIRRQLASARPDAFLPKLAGSLHNLSAAQSDLGRHEDALATIEETVRIDRQLGSTHPDAFLPDLARSLKVEGNCLAAVGRLSEAVTAAVASLRCLAPFVQRYPDTFRELANTTMLDYTTRSKELGVEPDPDVLGAFAHLGLE